MVFADIRVRGCDSSQAVLNALDVLLVVFPVEGPPVWVSALFSRAFHGVLAGGVA